MAIPILLVAGFLGAGKTTLVNRLLREPGGRRIAAVVNDFGSVGIDAALLGAASDGVVSLPNGCICCSLGSDLLRTLSTLTRRDPAPDAIVIETSGASDPAAITRSLLDPVIYAATPLETVVTLVDVAGLRERPDLADDPLWRSQIRAADLVVLAKTDLVGPADLVRAREWLERWTAPASVFEAEHGAIPPELLFAGPAHRPVSERPARTGVSSPRFETATWTADAPLSLARFQSAVGRVSARLVRAKGFVAFDTRPGQPMLFQLVGSRATLSPAPSGLHGPPVRLVFIWEAGRLDEAELIRLFEATAVGRDIPVSA